MKEENKKIEMIDERTLDYPSAKIRVFKIEFAKTGEPIISVRSAKSKDMYWERNFTVEDLEKSLDRAKKLIEIMREEL